MKNLNKKLSEFAKLIQENADGSLEGGFTILSSTNNAMVLGGTETNNCNGGNCVQGCGQNTVPACGGTANTAAGCGAPPKP